jgi:hypothetical protein
MSSSENVQRCRMQNSERRDEDAAGIGIGKKLDRGVTSDDSSQPSPPASSSNGNRRWESHGNDNGNNGKGSKRRIMESGRRGSRDFYSCSYPLLRVLSLLLLSFLSITCSSKARQLDHPLCYSGCYSMMNSSRHHCNLTCTSMSMIRMKCMMCPFRERNSSSSPNLHAKQPQVASYVQTGSSTLLAASGDACPPPFGLSLKITADPTLLLAPA